MNSSIPTHERSADKLSRDFGLHTPEAAGNPQVPQDPQTDPGLLRWTPLYVGALAAAGVAGAGLVVLAVL